MSIPGSTTLKNYANECFDRLTRDQKIVLMDMFVYLKSNYGKDWLLKLLFQFDNRRDIELDDALFYFTFCDLIDSKSVFLKILPVSSFAEGNGSPLNVKTFEERLDFFDFIINTKPQGNDGYLTLKKDMSFTQISQTDRLPQSLERITVNRGTRFNIEIGTTEMSKSVTYLSTGCGLARLPYEDAAFPYPFIALLYSRNDAFKDIRISA